MKEKSLKKNFTIYMVRNMITMFAPLIVFPYASRILGAAGIGRVQYVQSIITYFTLFSNVGIMSYGVREGAKYSDNSEKLGKLASELLIINSFIMLLMYVILFVISICLSGLSSYKGLLLLCSIDIFGSVIGMEWLYRAKEDFVYISIRTIMIQILAVVILLLFVKDRSDLYIYAFVLILPTAGAGFINFAHTLKTIPLFDYQKYEIRKHISPVLIVFCIGVSTSLYTLLDTTMLGTMLGDEEVGLYTAAYKVIRMAGTLISTMCTVFLPRFSYYFSSGNKAKYKELIINVFNFILGLSIPASVGLFVLSGEIIMIFSGSEFISAVPTMKILSLDLLLSALSSFFVWQVLIPQGKEKPVLFATISGGVVDFVLNWFWIPQYGIRSAAVSTIAAECIVSGTCFWAGRKDIYPEEMLRCGWQYMIASACFVGIKYLIDFLEAGIYLRSILTIMVCVLVYIVILSKLKNPFVDLVKKSILKQ